MIEWTLRLTNTSGKVSEKTIPEDDLIEAKIETETDLIAFIMQHLEEDSIAFILYDEEGNHITDGDKVGSLH